MSFFAYRKGDMHAEGVALKTIAAQVGTPFYCYSAGALRAAMGEFNRGMKGMNASVCYAMKANSSLAVIKLFAEMGAGADIVSEGEMKRALAAGVPPARIVYSGVGKKATELMTALQAGVGQINVESVAELETLNAVAGQLGKRADITIRVNPDVDAKTHAKITTGKKGNKFGIDLNLARAAFAEAGKLPHLRVVGIAMHIGSQLTSVAPFVEAVRKITPFVSELKALYGITYFSIGGGMGIVYKDALASGDQAWWDAQPADQRPLTPESYAAALVPLLQVLGLKIVLEHGRFMVGNSGVLLAKVEHLKRGAGKNFLIVDAAMNDLVRPAMYESYHEIMPLHRDSGRRALVADVVGPICESGDCFAKDRQLQEVGEGEYIAFMSAGAYGYTMASRYNTRAMAAEVLVKGGTFELINARETFEQQIAGEKIPAFLK